MLDSTINTILDRTPEELIGALLIALFLSLPMAGLYALWRRKVADVLVLLCALMILANVASMAVAAGYVVHCFRNPPDGPFNGIVFDGVAPSPGWAPAGPMAARGEPGRGPEWTQDRAALSVE